MQARWSDLVFDLDDEGARLLRSLNRKTALKINAQEDIVSSGSTVTKGLEPFICNIVFSTSISAGSDIQRLYQQYEQFLGESDYLYVGPNQFYDKQLQLISVEVSNMLLGRSGEALSADFNLTLREYTPETKRSRVVKSAGNIKKRPVAAVAGEALKLGTKISGTTSKPSAVEKANYASTSRQ